MTQTDLPNPADCDVADKFSLMEFRRCRARWLTWLLGNDDHSISRQLSAVLWDDAIFRLVNRARILASGRERRLNQPTLRLLDRCFVAKQLMAIRRLTDAGSKRRNRQVISLPQVLDDIFEHRQLVTRENYVAFDGVPYVSSSNSPGDIREYQSRRFHASFDVLSGVDSRHRARTDLILPQCFEDARKMLTECDGFRKFANKFIAHADRPSANRDRISEETKVSLDELNQSCRVLVRVASIIGAQILNECPVGSIPTPNFDYLEGLEYPLADASEFDYLVQSFDARTGEVEEWSQAAWPYD